jgi:hypothetical protein
MRLNTGIIDSVDKTIIYFKVFINSIFNSMKILAVGALLGFATAINLNINEK